MVGIKVDRGGGWKNFAKLIMYNVMTYTKDFKILSKYFIMLCFTSNFHRICFNLHETFFMA